MATSKGSRAAHVQVKKDWKSYVTDLKNVIKNAKAKGLTGIDGRQFSPARYDPADLEGLLANCHKVCEQLFDIVEKIHWPVQRYDSDGSLSTESAVEMTIRYLREPNGPYSQGVEGAWDLAHIAVRKYCEWRDNPHYANLGVNFGAYFAAELEAIMRVIEQDHLRLSNCKTACSC